MSTWNMPPGVTTADIPGQDECLRDDEAAALEMPPTAIDVEALIAACVPGGSFCDPQQVADAIRAYMAAGTGSK